MDSWIWWFLGGILTGAFLFQRKFRHAVITMIVWIFHKIEYLLNKTDSKEQEDED